MKLIGRYDSPYVRRVGVTLHVLELAFEHLPLSPFSQAVEFRKHAAIGRMPVLILDSGETLIESAAILDYLDEIAGPSAALIPRKGPERRKALQILACATAACDKAIAINYERRRPAEHIFHDWIERSRAQLDAALAETATGRDHDSLRLRLCQTAIGRTQTKLTCGAIEETICPKNNAIVDRSGRVDCRLMQHSTRLCSSCRIGHRTCRRPVFAATPFP